MTTLENQYLKISYTDQIQWQQEYNGYSSGVGRGTEVFKHLHFWKRRWCNWIFWGAVNANNLVMINSYDDSLDFDGYIGTITNVYINGVSFVVLKDQTMVKTISLYQWLMLKLLISHL
jgi:hypothetical protein